MKKENYYHFMLTMNCDEIIETFNCNVEYIIENQIDEDVLRWALQRENQYLVEDDEIFVQYPDWDGYYGSNYGRLISTKRKEPAFIKPVMLGRYEGYTLYKPDAKPMSLSIGRMVADIFCLNFYRNKDRNYVAVHHLDHNKNNNRWTNLVLIPKVLHERVIHPLEDKNGIMDPFTVYVSPALDGNLYPDSLK